MSERAKKLFKQFSYPLFVIFIIRCIISKDSLINAFSFYDLFGCISDSITLAGLLLFVYERYLWRFNPFESIPKLYGQYTGTIESTSDGICRDAEINIHQTLLTIYINQTTKESRSQSVNASIIDQNGEKCLIYTYLNKPNALVRERSSIHYGTASLCIEDISLVGDYFTDRKTTGVMSFKKK
jgi:hypothetical protein